MIVPEADGAPQLLAATPKVSVVVAAYNCAAFIDEALASVVRQTMTDLELIVVDDGSTDGTGAIIRDWAARDERILVVCQPNSGTAAGARNAGLRLARGEYVCFLDGDDTYHREKLAEQVRLLDAKPELGLCFHDLQLVREDGSPMAGTYLSRCNYLSAAGATLEPIGTGLFRSTAGFYPFMSSEITGITTLSVMIRRRVLLEEPDMFPAAQPVGEDIDLWFRLAARSAVGYIDLPLSSYRQHTSNITRHREKSSIGFIFAHSANLERARRRLSVSQVRRCRARLADEWFHLAYAQYRQGRSGGALTSYLESLRYSFKARALLGIAKTLVCLIAPGLPDVLNRRTQLLPLRLRAGKSVASQATGAAERPTWLFVIPWSLAALGGVNQVVINLAREMLRSGGYQPLVMVIDWGAIRPVFEEVHGLPTVRWRVWNHLDNTNVKRRVLYFLWERWFRKAFGEFCRDHQVAVINPHYPTPPILTLGRLAEEIDPGIRLILSFHLSDVTSISAASDYEKQLWRGLAVHKAMVVACSEDLASRAVAALGKDVKPAVVHNGVHVAELLAAEVADLAPWHGEGYILSVAKFEHKKGLDVLIRAYAAVAAEHPDVDLVLVGASAGALDSLRELSLRLGVDGRVHFFPDRLHRDLPAFFRRARIFALASRAEAFPIVLLEAAAFSLPVAATRVGGVPEAITDGKTGRLIPPDDPEALAAALRALLDSPETAAALGESLHRHVASNFTWESACRKYVALAHTMQQADGQIG